MTRPPCWRRSEPVQRRSSARAAAARSRSVCSIRHPEAVRGAILHEPGLYALLDDPDAVRGPLRALVQEAVEAGGPPAAVERFWRYIAGEDSWTKLALPLRERLQASAATLFAIELGTYERYLPDDRGVGRHRGARAAARQARRAFPSSPRWPAASAERLRLRRHDHPGTHAAYHDQPDELAEAVRPFLREASAISA